VQPRAGRGFRGVEVRAGVCDPVPVGRSPAQIATLQLDLGTHRGPHPDLDPVPLPPAHAAEDGHDEVVRLVVRVDRPADLRHPQRNAEVDEDGERAPELVAVEGALRLPDDQGIEPALRITQCLQELVGARASLPERGATVADVEIRGDDFTAGRLHECLGAGELPVPGRFGILQALGGTASGERETNHELIVPSGGVWSGREGPVARCRSRGSRAVATGTVTSGGCSGRATWTTWFGRGPTDREGDGSGTPGMETAHPRNDTRGVAAGPAPSVSQPGSTPSGAG
jgi:hypothetical protein